MGSAYLPAGVTQEEIDALCVPTTATDVQQYLSEHSDGVVIELFKEALSECQKEHGDTAKVIRDLAEEFTLDDQPFDSFNRLAGQWLWNAMKEIDDIRRQEQ